ncbi:MAG: CDP-diacylglycerol--serine O-phosphatidyltransferase [Bacteroidales bacterium]|nr:CDP-diacylglycerol--serine O-phosphatidyltransferase [Bacteroidales bacterium]MDD2385478.1 CDP-diacylglycerol--serine O-phosphatidyltransferase [Bacteroidales bacterium]MDD4216652.1 CDP-diacylglycerol--serine O-phosphatidyltransferase [Bacteroidales bacterium]MDY0141769.1 CDP-diacylglycerol--serine O-phosphatidyltransferase [Bacteroidales bacterium]
MKIRQVIPSAITALNLISGSLAIIFAFKGDIEIACLLVILSSIFDFFDGFAARVLKAVSEFGKQLDSLADLISFGFAPTAIFYKLFLIKNNSETFLAFSALLLVVFAALRLAKFNIDSEQKHEFKGLPTPAMALFIISISYFSFNNNSPISEFLLSPYSFVAINIVLSLLMVSNIKLMSLKLKTFKLKEVAWQLALVLGGVILLIIFNFLGIGLAIILYLALSFLKQILTIKKQ